MKRILICLLIATFSITAVHAQEKDELQAKKEQNTQNLKVYQQQQKQELQETIRTQTQVYIADAAKRMETEKEEVRKDLEARREQLMHRPAGMGSLSEEVKSRWNL